MLLRVTIPIKYQQFLLVASEEKIFENRPIRIKNCLWRPCLSSNWHALMRLCRGPSIHYPCQVWFHLAQWFQRRRWKFLPCTDWSLVVFASSTPFSYNTIDSQSIADFMPKLCNDTIKQENYQYFQYVLTKTSFIMLPQNVVNILLVIPKRSLDTDILGLTF